MLQYVEVGVYCGTSAICMRDMVDDYYEYKWYFTDVDCLFHGYNMTFISVLTGSVTIPVQLWDEYTALPHRQRTNFVEVGQPLPNMAPTETYRSRD